MSWALTAVVLVFVTGAVARANAADASGADLTAQARASEHFDKGLRHFEAAEFEAAARAFLQADLLVPNLDALANALSAAEKSGSHLLVATVASRAIALHSSDMGLVQLSRSALARAATHLSHLEIGCTPSPCTLELDGSPIAEGVHYALPGIHRISARLAQSDGSPSMVDERKEMLNADTSYVFQFSLHVDEASEAEPQNAAPLPQVARVADDRFSERHSGAARPSERSRAIIFYSGVGVGHP